MQCGLGADNDFSIPPDPAFLFCRQTSVWRMDPGISRSKSLLTYMQQSNAADVGGRIECCQSSLSHWRYSLTYRVSDYRRLTSEAFRLEFNIWVACRQAWCKFRDVGKLLSANCGTPERRQILLFVHEAVCSFRTFGSGGNACDRPR